MEKDTVWRISRADIESVIEDHFPDLPEEKVEEIIDRAVRKFSIHDWDVQVVEFIRNCLDE